MLNSQNAPQKVSPLLRPEGDEHLVHAEEIAAEGDGLLVRAEELAAEGETYPRSKVKGCLRAIAEVIETLVLAALLYLGINAVVARVKINGLSMYPTFKGGEFVLVYRPAYRTHPPKRGDIVVFHPNTFNSYIAQKAEVDYIKRIIGLPGEEVRVRGGKVYINGKALKEPYIAAPPRYIGVWRVPKGKVFVLGDNRNNSTDSHIFGPVPINRIIGRVIFVYYPFSEIRIVKRVKYKDP